MAQVAIEVGRSLAVLVQRPNSPEKSKLLGETIRRYRDIVTSVSDNDLVHLQVLLVAPLTTVLSAKLPVTQALSAETAAELCAILCTLHSRMSTNVDYAMLLMKNVLPHVVDLDTLSLHSTISQPCQARLLDALRDVHVRWSQYDDNAVKWMPFMITLCLNATMKRENDENVRIRALELLNSLVIGKSDIATAQIVSSYLPGILTRLRDGILRDTSTQHTPYTCAMVSALSYALTSCLRDDLILQDTARVCWFKDDEMAESVIAKCVVVVKEVCAQLIAVDEVTIRASLLSLCHNLIVECSSTLSTQLLPTVIDVICIIGECDEGDKLALVVRGGDYCRFIETLVESYSRHISRVTCQSASVSTQWSSLIGQLVGILYYLDERGRERLADDEGIVAATVNAILECTLIDESSTSVVSEVQQLSSTSSTAVDDLVADLATVVIDEDKLNSSSRVRLKSLDDKQIGIFTNFITRVVDVFGMNTLLDRLLPRISSPSVLYIVRLIISHPIALKCPSLIEFVHQTCLDALDEVVDTLDSALTDQFVHDTKNDDNVTAVVRARLLLGVLELTARLVTQSGDDDAYTMALNSTLYTLLTCHASSHASVVDSALRVLIGYSQQGEGKAIDRISETICNHGSAIVNTIGVRLRHPSTYPRAPLVLVSLLRLTINQSIFPSIAIVTRQLLKCIDEHYMTRSVLYMRAVLQVLRALHQWFTIHEDQSSIKAEIEEFERKVEEGEITRPSGDIPTVKRPAHVILAVQCLTRTKHLLHSEHLPLQLVTMDVLRTALLVCVNYEDELLPMVHQNWSTVLTRAKFGKMTDIQPYVVKVIATMCRVSKGFVRRRLVEEYLPIVICTLDQHAPHNKRQRPVSLLYAHSSEHRYLLSLLVHVPRMFVDIEQVAPEEMMDAVLLYNTDGASIKLREAAKLAIELMRNQNVD